MTPFSGPSQRSCDSDARLRQNPAKSGGDVVEPPADDEMPERLDRRRAHLVAAADRERQAVPFEPAVGLQDDVRRGVVGIRVHGVGAGAVREVGNRRSRLRGGDRVMRLVIESQSIHTSDSESLALNSGTPHCNASLCAR